MTDNQYLNERLEQIEARLGRTPIRSELSDFQNTNPQTDEIDLRELFSVLWQGKWWMVGIILSFMVVGVAYALSLPNMYKSAGVYAPAKKESGSAIGGLSGLASLAGVSIGGGESNDTDQATKLMISRPFLEALIDDYQLKPLILGVKGWSAESGIIWDEDVYDSTSGQWLREVPQGKQAEPSGYETYVAFSKMIKVEQDKADGMITVSIEHYSPEKSRDWVSLVVKRINEVFRTRDIADAKANIDYLERKVEETAIAEMQSVFYGMIESQMKTLMLAEVDEEYLFRVVVEPMVAEVKSSPKRALLVIVFVMLGGIFSLLFVFGKFIIRSGKK